MTDLRDEALLAQSHVRDNWKGVWIWPEDVEKSLNAYALFRRSFTCPDAGVLEVAITADSHYLLYLDGEFICRGPMRAPLDYYGYDTLSLTLTPGEHCLAVLAHHVGEVNATMMLGRPGLLVDAQAWGETWKMDLSTGSEWQATLSTAWRQDLPCMMSHFGFWEECDLTQLPADWTTAAFSAAGWGIPSVVGKPPCAPWTRLVIRDIPLPEYQSLPYRALAGAGSWRQQTCESEILSEKVTARIRSLADTPTALPFTYSYETGEDGRYLTMDFGRTVSGYVEISLEATQAGSCLDLSYDELLTADMAVNPERSYAHLSDRYLLTVGRRHIRTTHPRGFRYVTLDVSGPGSVKIEKITAIEETYPYRLQGAFASSDSALDIYYRKAAETVRICTTDAFTDCPTRERVQWMEDMYMHCRVSAYAFGDYRMLRHALFQAAQGALPDGRINGFFPSERVNCAFAASSMAWLHLLVDYWLFTGSSDITLLLPTAARLLAFLDTLTDDTGIITHWPAGQFWDWAPIEIDGCLLLTNAAYAWALARMTEHDVFRTACGSDLAARADHIRQAAHQRFWDPELRLYRDAVLADQPPIYSQQANSMAVLAGVCPSTEREAVLRQITMPARLHPVPVGEHSLKPNNRPSAERIVPVGTLWFAHFLCQALFETGLDEEAIAQMHGFWGSYPHLPTFPETRIQHGNTGHCHGWAGGPAFLAPAYILGIQPVSPDWETVCITPHPGPLAWARGTVMTPRGPISVKWERGQDGFDVQVELPAGVQQVP